MGNISRFVWRLVLGAAALAPVGAIAAPPPVTLGVLTDMSGFVADSTGRGSVVAAQLAAESFIAENPGAQVRVLSADHQNKPDIGAAAARSWIDRDGVNAILDVPFSSVALAVNEVTRGSGAAFLASGPGAVALTGDKCSPNTVHWTFDTWALANGTARALTKAGGDTWFFITADYAFGLSLENDATKVITSMGGKVLGDAKHPPSGSDFSSYLIAAQASGAKIVGLANAVTDTTNSIKQAAEFGLTANNKQRLAALLLQVTDVNALGLETAKGLYLTDAFYWDATPGTRAFSDRFAAKMDGKRPTSFQAGVYSSALAYLHAAKAVDSADARKVLPEMKRAPIEDLLFGTVTVRADGRAIHAMYLFQVKTPAESKGPWDYYKLLDTIPAEQAFRPLAEGGCKMAGF
jgi:branched-chain amino acid transport system substrate-binding protein